VVVGLVGTAILTSDVVSLRKRFEVDLRESLEMERDKQVDTITDQIQRRMAEVLPLPNIVHEYFEREQRDLERLKLDKKLAVTQSNGEYSRVLSSLDKVDWKRKQQMGELAGRTAEWYASLSDR